MRGVRIALVAGLALTALGLALTLSSAPAVVAPTRSVPIEGELEETQRGVSVCQGNETVPGGTTAIRLSLKAMLGPRIELKAFAGGRILTSGRSLAGWTSGAVTVPVRRVARTVTGAKVCLALAVRDETVMVLGGHTPTSSAAVTGEGFAHAEQTTLADLNQYEVRLLPQNHPIFARAEQHKLQADLAQIERSRQRPAGPAGVATGEPPLYYALQTIPYTLAGGTVLDRLALMRLLSALLAGITALFVFLFLSEALPAVPWAWTVGGLAVALAPLLGFVSGAVTPDAMLFALSAILFYCLARGFRRGLTPRLALTIGAVTGVGLVTKLNFIGLLPGVLLGLTVLALRARRRSTPPRGAGSLALALVAIAAPVLATIAVDALSNRPPLGPAFGVAATSLDHHGTLLGELTYVWQLYLPRLPGMTSDFHNGFAPREIWFDGYVGLYGWLDTTFPTWVYTAALVPASLLAGLCLRTLVRGRSALHHRAGELTVYAAIAAGLLLLVGARSYSEFPTFGDYYGEARYLLPLLPLLGATLALAARSGGRRWGPILGTLIVVLAFAHDIFSQLQVVARYYN
jgi:hypothetical protein